jgi:GxxExxY protein
MATKNTKKAQHAFGYKQSAYRRCGPFVGKFYFCRMKIRGAYKRPGDIRMRGGFFCVFCGNWIVGLNLSAFGCGFAALDFLWPLINPFTLLAAASPAAIRVTAAHMDTREASQSMRDFFVVIPSDFFLHEKAMNTSKHSINQLCDIIRETSYAIHRYHRNGHLEKIYENALANRLRKQGLNVRQQHPLHVYDEDGTMLGEFFADLIIEDRLILELKAVKAITDEHISQILGYLRSARIETGLLINFGSPRIYIKKYLMTDSDPSEI